MIHYIVESLDDDTCYIWFLCCIFSDDLAPGDIVTCWRHRTTVVEIEMMRKRWA